MSKDITKLTANKISSHEFTEGRQTYIGKRSFANIDLETYVAADEHDEIPPDVSTPSNVNCISPEMEKLPFYSGNPFVEKTEGILHIYKQNERTLLQKGLIQSRMLAMMAVPAVITSRDLLQFLAPVIETISSLRVIRDSSQNCYMVLLKFRSQEVADDFYLSYNGVEFNSIESGICRLAYVDRVETLKESENACLPIEGHTELPTCAVCLERMDESVDGILTILCNHAFHSSCLSQWGDTSCPVCRYCQTPEMTMEQFCSVCGKKQDLWICLVCGSVGCGRYAEGHAQLHFRQTQHTYSLQIGSQRVWDYAGDNYVHRLIQNKSDGKLVEVQGARSDAANLETEEKLDAVTLEYSYLLTTQLESQRLYFEDKFARVEKDYSERLKKAEEQLMAVTQEFNKLKTEVDSSKSCNQTLEKKLQQVTSKHIKVCQELKEEKEMNTFLRSDQNKWASKVQELQLEVAETKQQKEREVTELQEQLRDLMFHLEAESKLAKETSETQEEIRSGQLLMSEASAADASTTQSNRRRRRQKH